MKQEKNYTVIVKGGRMTLSSKDKGADGRYHSVSCECPHVSQVYDEESGKSTLVRKTRKQTEEYLATRLQISLARAE